MRALREFHKSLLKISTVSVAHAFSFQTWLSRHARADNGNIYTHNRTQTVLVRQVYAMDGGRR